MKIIDITDGQILFDNGSYISYYHSPDGCEVNYADFKQLNDTNAMDTEFDLDTLKFEAVNGSGFRFGNEGNMFFVPCYSDQSYSDQYGFFGIDLNIIFDCVVFSILSFPFIY